MTLHAHTTQRFRKAITPAHHWQRRNDRVRVVARRHQKAVAAKFVEALNKIADAATHLHGHTRDMSHAQVMKDGPPDEPRDEHGRWTEGGSSLPMDEVSRMGRAKEQGFDTSTKYYHGSSASFSEFKSSTDESGAGAGVYITADPQVASSYTNHAEGAQVYPLLVRGKLATQDDLRANGIGVLSPVGADRDKLKGLGFTGIQFSNVGLVWDPKDIRSVHAGFDPAAIDSSHLLKAQVMKEFDPDQPRDDQGRWVYGGAALTHLSDAAAKNEYKSSGGFELGNSQGHIGVYENHRRANSRGAARGKGTSTKYTHLPLGGKAGGGKSITHDTALAMVTEHGIKENSGRTWTDITGGFKKATNPGALEVHVTTPTPNEIQVLLRPAMEAVAAAAAEVAQETASEIAAKLGPTAAENFMAQWQDYMTGQIKAITDEVQASVQQIVSAGANAGLGPGTTARDIRDLIGLTERQQGYVDSYRTALENLDSNALTRALRNTRNDNAVQEAIDLDRALSADRIDSMVARYATTWRNYRADMIARTELITANNAGARAGIDEAINSGLFGRGEMRRYWLVAMDEDTCPICLSIPELNPEGVGMDEDFDSDDGPVFAPTVHPNCRCSIAYRAVLAQDEPSK